MDKSIRQALDGLIPALAGPPPPELRELAVSLLAQSRVKASSLKADEEIARSYVCANLACERLKQTLALPKIQPRPPCPPRIYQKLYKFLDAALLAGTRQSERSPKVDRSASMSTSSPAKPKTPVKRTPLKPTIPRRTTPRHPRTTSEIPKWVMPTVRQLCKTLGAPKASPHVFVGVSSILTLPSPREEDSTASTAASSREIKTPALIIAVLFIVTTRLSGVETRADEYSRQRAKALALLRDSATEQDDREQVKDADVNDCMKEIRDQGWTDLDWFANIPIGGGLAAVEAENIEGEASADEEAIGQALIPSKNNSDDLRGSNGTCLQAGLGTMMRDQVDYLSEDRRDHYQRWKSDILLRIKELQEAQEMDITVG